MSGIASALGVPHELEFRGKKYSARLVAQKVKGQIERAYQAKARREVCAMAAQLPPEQAGAAVEAHAAKVLAGEYSFTARRCRELLGTPDGTILLAAVIFGTDEDTVAEMLLDPAKGREALEVLRLVAAESFPGAAADAGAADPNG